MLYDAYTEWARKGHRHIEHSSSMGKKLKELAGVKTTRPSATQDPDRKRVYVLTGLTECRKQFETYVKQPWYWGDEDSKDSEAEAEAEAEAEVEVSDTFELGASKARERHPPERLGLGR